MELNRTAPGKLYFGRPVAAFLGVEHPAGGGDSDPGFLAHHAATAQGWPGAGHSDHSLTRSVLRPGFPGDSRQHPLCGYLWESVGAGESEATPLANFVMSEIDLLKRSSFRWCDLFGDDAALVANGFNAWGGIFFLHGRWHAVGGAKGQRSRLLAVGERTVLPGGGG